MSITINNILAEWDTRAVIFDLDGTLIDNNAYHLRSWLKYLEAIGRNISEEEYRRHINGRTNRDAIEYIYGRKMGDEEAMRYTLEKEAVYRDMYRPFIRPLDGLSELLRVLQERKIPMAIATSGIQVNIDFMFDHIPIRPYFSVIVNSAHIQKGKPDPEIYLRAAAELKTAPAYCLVFEDAAVGVSAARAAGMKVIALTTTQTREELAGADRIITDYRELLPSEYQGA